MWGPCCHAACFSGAAKTKLHPWLQGPPGLKGEQGDTVVIDYDGRILDALKVSTAVGHANSCRVMGREGAVPVLLLLPDASTQSQLGGKSSFHPECGFHCRSPQFGFL